MDAQNAQPKDELYREGYFYTSDLTFLATCELKGINLQITSVEIHPFRPSTKVFYIQPEDKTKELYYQYLNGAFEVNPYALSLKAGVIRRTPLTDSNDERYIQTGQLPKKNNVDDFFRKEKPIEEI